MRVQLYPLLWLGLLLSAAPLRGQQTPFLNQYTWDPRLFNPAGQGGANGGAVSVVYRSQFQQLDAAVRPTTYLVHADISPWIGQRIGLGVQALGDKAHIMKRLQLSGFFGYHLVQSNRMRFSLGLTAGLLNQSFDFEGVRVGDVLDLSVLQGQPRATRFDGGPGLALTYYTTNGSFFALDAAAPQLFNSDVRIEATDGQAAAVYDVLPHFLANARFHWQGRGFALEPNLAFRAVSAANGLQRSALDLNLNSYFLSNSRLMLGAGWRTDGGGLHAQVGVLPVPALRLTVSGEWHSALGATYEVGASYLFSRREYDPMSDVVLRNRQEAQGILMGLDSQFADIKRQHELIRRVIAAGSATRERKQQTAATDQCVVMLAQTGQEINQLRLVAAALEAKRMDMEQLAAQLEAQRRHLAAAGMNEDLSAVQAMCQRGGAQLDALAAVQQELSGLCANLRPPISLATCLRSGDRECLDELFNTKLQEVPGLPQGMFPLQLSVGPGLAVATYRYPDDEDAYVLTPALRALAGHIADQVQDAASQGVRLTALEITTELQEDENTLGFQTELVYDGALGDLLPPYTLMDGKTGTSAPRTLTLAQRTELTLGDLAALKIVALRRYFTERGIEPSKIILRVRFNQSENTYREETKVALHLRE